MNVVHASDVIDRQRAPAARQSVDLMDLAKISAMHLTFLARGTSFFIQVMSLKACSKCASLGALRMPAEGSRAAIGEEDVSAVKTT